MRQPETNKPLLMQILEGYMSGETKPSNALGNVYGGEEKKEKE
jgi:hypothetical protein